MTSLILYAAALAFAPAAAASAPQAGQAAQPAPQPRAPKEPVICRSNETTASRLGKKKICRTAADWRAHDDGMDSTRAPQRGSDFDRTK